MEVRYSLASPLGEITLAGEGPALTGLWFQGQRFFAATLAPDCQEGFLPVFDRAAAWLEAYFRGENPGPTPPLAPRGTAFQRRVWQALEAIPYGETRTYGELAAALGSSARAVGSAVARNPLSLLIPCHRAVGAHGDLTGYAGGLDRKAFLLALERGDPIPFPQP